ITASDGDGSAGEKLTGMLETNSDIVSGDSGGPLVDSSGQVVGMDTAASTSGAQDSGLTTGTITSSSDGYAIPITSALSIAAKIVHGKASSTIVIGTPGFLGLELSSGTSSTGSASGSAGGSAGGYGSGGYGSGGYGSGGYGSGGYGPGGSDGFGGSGGIGGFGGFGSDGSPYDEGTALTTPSSSTGTTAATSTGVSVAGVIASSPAATAGIAAGDTITALDGNAITSVTQLSALLDKRHAGDKVTVTWTDTAATSHHASVTLIAGPAA
ncbi:MAG TPA: PDZ domain-containing protein, partial [Micromonosporaceae bacterium]